VRVTANAIGWLVIIGCVSIALAFSAAARGDSLPAPSLTDRIAALVPRYGSRKVELVDAQEFAAAVDTACNHDRECAARLVAMAVAESGLSAAVARSEYLPHQGDAYTDKNGVRVHRAWGLFQAWKNSNNAHVWGDDNLLIQARAARSMQLGALAECRKYRDTPPELGMWRVLSGRGCRLAWPGEEMRMVLVAKIRRAL
jgi:hypothetical protein